MQIAEDASTWYGIVEGRVKKYMADKTSARYTKKLIAVLLGRDLSEAS